MIGIIISCIGILGLLVIMTVLGFTMDWKFGVSGIFLTIIIIGVFLILFI